MNFWEQDQPVDGVIDPRLETAIADEQNRKGGARPKVMATLLEEKNNQKEKGYWGPVYGAVTKPEPVSTAKFWEKDTPVMEEEAAPADDAFWKNDKPAVEAPSWGRRAQQALADTAGLAGEAVTMMAGGVAGLVSKEAGDKLFQISDETADYWNNLVLTPEEREAGSTKDKIAANVLGMAPALVAGKLAGPILGAGTGIRTAKEFIKAGESTGDALLAGAVQGGAQAIGIAAPAFGRTVGHTAALILGTGPVLGAAADKLTSEITDNKNLKQMFQWDDPVARGTDLVAGTLFGAHAHYNSKMARIEMQLKHYAKTDPDAYQKTIDEFRTEIGKLFRWNDIPDARLPGEDWKAAGDRLYKGISSAIADVRLGIRKADLDQYEASGIKGISAAQAAEIIFHNAETPTQMKQAKFLLDQAAELGLNLTEVFTVDRVSKAFPHRADLDNILGLSRGNQDDITVSNKEKDLSTDLPRRDFYGTVLHEIQHAIDNRVLTHIELALSKELVGAKNTTVFENQLIAKGATKRMQKAMEFMDFLRNHSLNNNTDLHLRYGMQDLHEFFSEMFADDTPETPNGKTFIEALREVKMDAADIAKFWPELDMRVTNQFSELARALRGPGYGNKPSTALDLAIQTYFGLMEFNNLDIRTRANTATGAPRVEAENLKTSYKDSLKEVIKTLRKDPYKRMLYRQLFNSVHRASSFEEFMTLAALTNGSPQWKQFLKDHGETIYARSNLFSKALLAAGGYKDLPDVERALVMDDRSSLEFIEDELKGARDGNGEPVEDLGLSVFSTTVHNPNVIRRLAGNGFAGRVLKFILDKGDFWAGKADRLYVEAMNPVKKAWSELKNKHEKAALFDAMQTFNRPMGRKRLEKLGLQWATEDMMRTEFGLNDRQIEAYKALTSMYDTMHDLANQALKKNPHWDGKDLPKLPGFMPNFHDGAYKVFVKEEYAPGQWAVVQVKGFKTSRQAEFYAHEMIRQGYEIDQFGRGSNKKLYKLNEFSEMENPLIVSMREGLSSYFQLDKLGMEAAKQLQEAEDVAMQGFVKHFQERSDVSGYTGEFGAKPSKDPNTGKRDLLKEVQWHLFGHSDAFKIHERYARGITEAWKNAMFLANEWQPIMSLDAGYMTGHINKGAFLEDFPKLHKYLAKYGLNFVGKETNALSGVDESIKAMFKMAGLDPNLGRETLRSLRSGLAIIKLRMNPANWAMNLIQPAHMMAWLQFTNTESGYKGSPMKSLLKLLSTDFKPDPELSAALQRMRENRLHDPQLQMEITESDRNGPFKAVASDIEEFGRTASFAMAFMHFRDQFKDVDRAYQAAQQAMQQVMVNYDQHSRPLMYQNFGMAGHFAAPFAVYRNAYFGNTYLMFRQLFKNPGKLEAYMPLLTSQALYWAAAGTLGMYGAGEWNMVADTWNEFSPEDQLPRAEDVFFNLGMSDTFIFGPMSTYGTKMLPGVNNGAYIGPSGSAVSIDDAASLPMANFIKAIRDTAGLTVKGVRGMMGGVAPSASDVYPVGRQFIPPVLQAEYDKAFQNDNSDVAFTTSGLQGSVRRDDDDIWAIRMTGKQSIDEAKQRIKERTLKRKTQLETRLVKGLVQNAADHAQGLPNIMSMENILRRAGELGMSEEEFKKKVEAEVINRQTTTREREALTGASSMSGARKQQKREELGQE